MKTRNHRIDVHYHIIPKPYVDALASDGITGAAWGDFPRWTPEKAIRYLDRMEIQTAITSLSTPGVWFGDAASARRLSRLCNEFQAQMRSDHPGRFGAFAFLPLPDMDGALAELEHALDQLGHDGVALLSDVEGRYLGDPAYEDLFAEMDRRSAVVFIHPHTDPRENRRYRFFSPLLEWPVHTTRAVLDLLYSGRLARYPNIRYILAHGGGTVPYLAHRIAARPEAGGHGRAPVPGEAEEIQQENLELLRNLYYDAAAPGDGHLAALQAFTGARHILFGTDGGWTPPVETDLKIKVFLAYDGFTPSDREAIETKNAATLFPRFGSGCQGDGQATLSTRIGSGTPLNGRPRGSGSIDGVTTVESNVVQATSDARETQSQSILLSRPLTDIHHHAVPPGYREALERAGVDTSGIPSWTPEGSLHLMDRLGISRAMLSVSSPGVWFGDNGAARSLARACNEYLAELKSRHPDRFGGLATLPFPALEGSRKELAHALDHLGLDGVILFSNVGGRYVGEPEFDALMGDLHERQTTVLLHPNHLPATDLNAPLHPWTEYPIDLARAWSRMVYHGILVRFPGIRWVLAQAGGVVPYMADRLGKVHYLKGNRPRWGRIILDLARKRDGGLELAKAVSYDTVGATNPSSLPALRRVAKPERIRFGSDFPWASTETVEASIRFLTGANGTSLSDIAANATEGVEP